MGPLFLQKGYLVSPLFCFALVASRQMTQMTQQADQTKQNSEGR